MRAAILRTVPLLAIPAAGSLVFSLACGGNASSHSSKSDPNNAMGVASVILTDAPSDQWSAVEVVVTQVAFLNKADHTKEVVVFSGASTKVNLVDLDSVGELLASAKIPVGTYDAVRITIDPANVNLVKSDGTSVPASQIHVEGTAVTVKFSADLVVTAAGNNAVQLDFDLGHPLFLVQLPNGDWSLNLQVKHLPNVGGMTKIILRHRKGSITSVSATQFVLHTDHGNDLTVNVDGGAWFYDTDAKAVGSLAGLAAGKNALVSLRMQGDGSLWAVRVWYGTNAFQDWTPEGHVFGVDQAHGLLRVSTSNGAPKTVVIDNDTTFTYHVADAMGQGTAALAKVWKGFKVQLEVKDPLASPLHARSVDIQRAVDSGTIKSADATQFTYQHMMATDRTYAYANPFTWWYMGFPGQSFASTADFASAVTGAGDVRVQGTSDLTWNATSNAWDASSAIFTPVNLPQGTITASYAGGSLGFSFTNSGSAAQNLTISLNETPGMQPLVLELNRQTGAFSAQPVPVSAWSTKLVASTKTRVAVVPKPDGTFAAYSVVIFTGF